MSLDRRIFIAGAGAALAAAPRWAAEAQTQDASINPFTLGVASGSPRETSVILWTRLAPAPLLGGGMAPGRVEVRVRVARDPAMRDVIIDALVPTSEAFGHAVHYKAQGLTPGREYWYQFSFKDAETVIGRTRTTSPKDAAAKIAVAYCQHYEAGFFAAYRDLAEWAPDCVIHVGDYIYEGGVGVLGPQLRDVGGGERRLFEVVRQHNGPEIVSLWDYRNRYALYRMDPDLQAAHAAAPWIAAMDDHEVDNNWAGLIPQDPDRQTPLEFQVRRMAAFQAFYEHMPMESPPVVRGTASRLPMHGLYRFGPVQAHLLDTRQYRSDQPCGDGRKVCPDAADPARTMLGLDQERWLAQALARSSAPHNLLATQIWFTPYRYTAPPADPVVNVDSWDGYPAARQRLIDTLARGVSNPVFVAGDWHAAMASVIHERPGDPASKRIACELVGASISSGCPWARDMEQMREANPHVKYLNGVKRGYQRLTITAEACDAEFRIVTDPGQRASPLTTDLTLRTKDL